MKRRIQFKMWHEKTKSFTMPFELTDIGAGGAIINQFIDCEYPILTHGSKIVQFTGNKDKNGIEIYEGDFDSDGNCVLWCENCNGWEFAQLDTPTKDICIPCHRCDGNFFFEDHINDFEIAGNIFSLGCH